MKNLKDEAKLSLASTIAILSKTKIKLGNRLKTLQTSYQRLAFGGRDSRRKVKTPSVLAEKPQDCLQAIIDGLEDEVMIVGPDFRIRQVNDAMLRRLGMPAASIVGQTCFQVSHGADEPCHPPWCECPLSRVVATGKSAHTVHSHWGSKTEQDGERWVEIVVSPIWDNNGRITEVIELVKDISENKRLQMELLKANRELVALNSIARALSQSLDLKPTLQAVAETMLDALETQVSWVKLLHDSYRIQAVRSGLKLSAQALDELIAMASSIGLNEPVATSASYSVLPDDNDVHNQTIWQFVVTPLKLKGAILGTTGVATSKRPVDQQRIQLLDVIGNQIAVAVERCKLYEEVQLARDSRGELLGKVIAAQEEERRRIARELHDETGQTLTALRLCLDRLALAPYSSAEERKTRLAQALDLCRQADEEVDKLISDLRPTLLDDLGLVEAIKVYAETRLKTAGTKVSLRVTGEDRRLSSEKEAALFRVIQEAITNIVKHARAKSAVIYLQFKTNQLVAQINDDGCGFKMSEIVASQNPKRGLGLLGMRERISLIGGSLNIVSTPGMGTRLKVAVPLDLDGVPG